MLPSIQGHKEITDVVCIGHSEKFRQVLKQAATAAQADVDVVIEGESGCGRQLLARLIHADSRRCDGPFVAITCAALSEAVADRELLGDRCQLPSADLALSTTVFEQAHGGTLLLDEIGEMSPTLQSKLLRMLQLRQLYRAINTPRTSLDVRVIATTSRDLRKMVFAGAFRADLYYRLNAIPLRIPPLHERTEDIPLLIQHFASAAATEFGVEPPALTPQSRLCKQHTATVLVQPRCSASACEPSATRFGTTVYRRKRAVHD